MKKRTTLATTIFAVTFSLQGFPLLAQQSPAATQPDSPAAQQSPSSTELATPNSAAANPAASAVEMSPINGELVNKLDSKTAKTGDSVLVQTKAPAKISDGTEIHKGSKLVGHVIGAQPSGSGENSQVALLFDHIELKGGQSLPIHSQIQSIAPAGGATSASGSAGLSGSPAGSPSNPSVNGINGGNGTSGTPQGTGGSAGAASAASDGGPAAGTVVAKTGQIAISTTSIPGVLLANNAPGQKDPRMAQASSILLGAKQDIQLNSGTQMVVGISGAAQ